MCRPRDPQSGLFTSALLLPDELRHQLDRDWPGEYRRSILPLIDDESRSGSTARCRSRCDRAI